MTGSGAYAPDARARLALFDSWAVTHVRREDNKYADQLGRLALREEGP